MSLSRRIEKLEHQQIRQQPPPLFIKRDGAVAGWRGGGVEVWRRADESETELQDRVTAEHGGPVLWVSIKPGEEAGDAASNIAPAQTKPSAGS